MKLVTFNIRCDYGQDGENNFMYRKPLILDKLKKEQADILCFQEVLPHVAIWLRDNLNDYTVVGCGREADLSGEQMTIAYNKSKYELLELKFFWLSPTPNIPGSRFYEQSDCPRMCTVGLFRDMIKNQTFRVYNTHLDHISSQAREQGLLVILNKLKEASNLMPLSPIILTGDFNDTPNSKLLHTINKYNYLVDITKDVQGSFHDFGKQVNIDKIDYIFAENAFSCQEVKVWDDCVNGVYLSDHYPICVDILLKE